MARKKENDLDFLGGLAIDCLKGIFRWVLGEDTPKKKVEKAEPPMFDRNEYLHEHREEVDNLTGKELIRLEARRRAREMVSLKAVSVPLGESAEDDSDNGDSFYPDRFSPEDKEFFEKFGESVPVPHSEPVKVPFENREWLNAETRRAMAGMRRSENSSW